MSRIVLTMLLVGVLLPATAGAQDAPNPCEGWTTNVVATGLGSLENLEPDGAGGMLISASTRNAVERLLPDGTVDATVAADMPSPGGLRVRDGVLFANTGDSAADGAAGNTNGTIERIDLATGDRTTYTEGLTMPNGLVFDAAGNAYTSRDVGSPSHITKVPADDPANPDTEWADLPDTNGLAIDPTGELLYVATTFNAPASVYQVRLDDPTDITEIAQLVGEGGPNPAKGLDDMTIDADGVLYITANGSGELFRLDPATGDVCLITGALQNASAVKFGAGPGWPADHLYVSAFDGRVVEVVPPAADQQEGDTPPATPGEGPVPQDFSCSADSWVAGTSELCGGVLTHRDYVYDDYGADLGTNQASTTGSLAQPAGDTRYPEEGPHNTADLVDLSLRINGDRLEVLAELNALHDPGTTVLALAIDTDDDATTGGGEWPTFDNLASDGWDVLHTFDTVDVLANLIGGSVPLPPGDRWRVQAVVAQEGTPRIPMNVAFRGPDEQSKFTFLATAPPGDGAWFEDNQAAALAAGDISAFGLAIDVADLRPGGPTRQLDDVGPGLHERVYTSDVTLPPGEGMDYEGIDGRGTGGPTAAFGQVFHYYGRYQPYAVYLPDQAGPHGLAMIYHGSNQNHSQLVNLPGFQAQVAEAHNRLLASPLARGVHGYGSDISERDLQDVRVDVLATYDIDESRVIGGGYSQGGYVTFRQAAMHPDEYSAFITWVGFTGDAANPAPNDAVTAGAVGNVFDFVRNYRHVPGAMIYGGADELVHPTSSEGMANEFRTRDFPFIFYMHPTADHFLFALADEWAKESDYAAQWTRVTNPARVVFRAGEVLGQVDAGARHDRAYWVSQLRGRDTVTDPFQAEDAYIDVDLTSLGCGAETPLVTLTPGAGPQPVPWTSDEHVSTGVEGFSPDPRMTGTLANVASLAIDVDQTCLTGAFDYTITSDGPARVRLSDGRTIDLVAGENTGRLEAGSGGTTVRLAGGDRVATAVEVSRNSHDAADTVVIARADDYADALAAGPLAVRLGAPLLLTGGDALDPRVAEEVQRLGATTAVLIGGEQALTPAVADGLPVADLTRLAGADRFATAAVVADAVVDAGGDPTSVYLVEGANADPDRGWPDAVAAGALAARQGRAILLATRDTLPASTLAALRDLSTTTVTVIGGRAAITDRTLAMAADPDGDGIGTVALNRIHGATRYETSAAVADRTLVDLATTEQVWLVTGRDWPDALTAGPAAAASGGVLLMVDGQAPGGGAAAAEWRAAHQPIERTVLVGGPSAILDGG